MWRPIAIAFVIAAIATSSGARSEDAQAGPEQSLYHYRAYNAAGQTVSGALEAVTLWDHRMAVSADPAGTGKTLYRDQLIFGTGALTLPSWPVFWMMWQWRMLQLKRLAPTWRFDVGIDAAGFAETTGGDASAGPDEADVDSAPTEVTE